MIDNVCLSGGAKGADSQWGMTAGKAGHMVIHFSFGNHYPKVPREEVAILTESQLLEADIFLIKANETLKRSFPTNNTFVNNLLRRNWYQVKDAERVYAVGTIKNGLVEGGTSWATQMFIDRIGTIAPIYVFDQVQEKWFTWHGRWIEISDVPEPVGAWAGIGTRDLNTVGKNEIRRLMKYSPK